jgi:prepilin-type N-terminal cleavage/methylation domain-containing protein
MRMRRTTTMTSRGFTVPELLIAMTIMGIVLALAVVEFAMVFNHNALTTENVTAEQNARIAMARVTNELRQAMPDFTDFSNGKPVVQPTAPPPSTAPGQSTVVEFYRVDPGPQGLSTSGAMPVDSFGNPIPCYDDETLTYDPVAKTITRTISVVTNSNCPNANTTTDVLARNILNFWVTYQPYIFDVDLETESTNGQYGVYDLNSQVALGYKP